MGPVTMQVLHRQTCALLSSQDGSFRGELTRLSACRLIAKGDPNNDTICADIRARITALPTGSVVLAEDETQHRPATQNTILLDAHQTATPGEDRDDVVLAEGDVLFELTEVDRIAVSIWAGLGRR